MQYYDLTEIRYKVGEILFNKDFNLKIRIKSIGGIGDCNGRQERWYEVEPVIPDALLEHWTCSNSYLDISCKRLGPKTYKIL